MSIIPTEIFSHGIAKAELGLSTVEQDDQNQAVKNELLRPAVPMLLLPLMLTWLAMYLACHAVKQQIDIPIPLLLVPTLALIAITISVLKNRNSSYRARLMLLSLFCFSASATSATVFWQDIAADAKLATSTEFKSDLQITTDASQGALSKTSTARATLADGRQVDIRIFWDTDYQPLPKGSWIKAGIGFVPLKDNQGWLFDQGICGSANLSNIQVLGFEQTVLGAIDSFRHSNVQMIDSIGTSGSALLSGILLGYRESLANTAVNQDFKTCGLSHLIAVSGSHLAIVAALCAWFLMRLPGNKKFELVVLVAILVLYVLLTALQPSAIRAAVMAAVAGMSFFVGRRGHAPSALCLAAVAMMVVYPANAFSVGFWLSVLAVLGITIFTNFNQSWFETALIGVRPDAGSAEPVSRADKLAFKTKQKRLEPISSAVAMTISATTATMPLSIPMFAMFSLISPLANLLVSPLVTLMLVLGMLALCVSPFLPWLAQPVIVTVSWIGDFVATLAGWLARIPYASVPADAPIVIAIILTIVVAAIIYLIWPTPSHLKARMIPALALALCLIFAAVSPLFTPAQLVVMDIGQGDAILVREGGSSVLIDTGASETALMRALARSHITRLDAVVITHLDTDHYGALARLRGLVSIDNIYFASGLLKNQPDDKAITDATAIVGEQGLGELSAGDTLQLGKTLSMQLVWPQTGAVEGSNQESICLMLNYDIQGDGIPEHQSLLTGDAEQDEIGGILRKYPNLKADIYKVGHHGSNGAITLEQLQALESQIAIISVGANNRYGHPTAETLQTLESADCRIFRTDLNGDITVRFNSDNLTISCANMNQEIY